MNNRRQAPIRFYAGVLAVLVVAGSAAYSNCFDNVFQLDDMHSIRENPYVRSLAHIPRYFSDARTFTRYLPNADYRPLLQVTYAINYAIAGYAPWIWHATNLALHIWVAFCVFLVGRSLFGTGRIRAAPLTEQDGDRVALVAALLFVVHPVSTGVVDYISGRSSLMVAVFLMPATLLYLCFLRSGALRDVIGAAALMALALLTKAEAISFLGIVIAAELILRDDENAAGARARWTTRAAGVAPFALIAAAYLGLRSAVVPPEFAQYRQTTGMEWHTYLLTQFHAWWYYVGQLLAPLRQIADYVSYPVSRSLFEARVLLALGGWIVVGAVALMLRRRAPQVAFLVGAYLIYLSPTSSFVPLAQMVNEHRPYLPVAGLTLLIAWGVVAIARGRRAVIAATVVLAVVLGGMTFARNRVFASQEAFWRDIVEKDPASARAQMSYALTLGARNQLVEAETHFRNAIRLEPAYHYARFNYGNLLGAQGRTEEARFQFDAAVALAPMLPEAYYWRGIFLRQSGDLDGAIADFQAAVARANVPTRELKELAGALFAAGRVDEARAAVAKGSELDAQAFVEFSGN